MCRQTSPPIKARCILWHVKALGTTYVARLRGHNHDLSVFLHLTQSAPLLNLVLHHLNQPIYSHLQTRIGFCLPPSPRGHSFLPHRILPLAMAAPAPHRSLIILLVAWLVAENGGAATETTSFLSSRLIHRFSDEMKARRGQRNGSVAGSSWPERKRSVQYYQTLLSADFRRQSMKLGARYQLLFPSQGSKTVSFGNDFGWFVFIAFFVVSDFTFDP